MQKPSNNFETILFADIVGSTQLYQQLGDTKAHLLIAESLAVSENAITASGGKLLRTVGDATLSCFNHPQFALDAAVSIHAGHNELPVRLRTGFHAGAVIHDKGDVYGHAVNVAARIASLANPGEIVTTEACTALLTASGEFQSQFINKIQVKGIEQPVHIYRVTPSLQAGDTTAVSTKPDTKICRTTEIEYRVCHRGQSILISRNNPRVSIGRDSINDMPIKNDHASREHAIFEWSKEKLILTDRSTNGTHYQTTDGAIVFVSRAAIDIKHNGLIAAGFIPYEYLDDCITITKIETT